MVGVEVQLFNTSHDRALRSMPSDWAQAYILTDMRGLDQDEAAVLLDVSQQAVSRRAAQARRAIREELMA